MRSRSRTSWATSGWSVPTTWAYFVNSAVIPLVMNCASTCANHRVGSRGQYGGSLMLIADVTGGGVAVACSVEEEALELVELVESSMMTAVGRVIQVNSRRGHQFGASMLRAS